MKKNCILILITVIMAIILPVHARAADLPPDGQYTIEVALSGGSGRANVESPAELMISGGAMTARITWSSPYYDFMLIEGTYYYPVNTQGNAAFEIPVLRLDEDIKISAETIAMSEPHVIDYALRFDSSTLKVSAGGNGTTVIFALAAAVLAAIVLAVVRSKRRRKNGSENE